MHVAKSILAFMELQSIISSMTKRHLLTDLHLSLTESPAVALLGPRQVGKTTLALSLSREQPSLYLV
jgi:predicted AAA+ superfamily ATPase